MDHFIGIDVAKATLHIAPLPDGEGWTVTNDEQGLAELAPRLVALAPALVVLEATGGFEFLAAITLAMAGLPVAMINPRQVRDLAKVMGQLAKTDALDATLLADFAQRVRPEPRPLPDEAAQLLERLLTRRRQIVDVLTAAKNRLGFARGPVKRDISQHFRWLEERLADEGGRAPVLAVLDVAALVGLTHTPVIRVRYERRRAAGKPFKTAATARRRKLLTILNAMLTHHRRWGPEYA